MAATAGVAVALEGVPAAAADLAVLAAAILEAGGQAVTGKTQAQAESLLADLTGRLKTALGDRLISLILYGSASMGDRLDQLSDLNVLCVLDENQPSFPL